MRADPLLPSVSFSSGFEAPLLRCTRKTQDTRSTLNLPSPMLPERFELLWGVLFFWLALWPADGRATGPAGGGAAALRRPGYVPAPALAWSTPSLGQRPRNRGGVLVSLVALVAAQATTCPRCTAGGAADSCWCDAAGLPDGLWRPLAGGLNWRLCGGGDQTRSCWAPATVSPPWCSRCASAPPSERCLKAKAGIRTIRRRLGCCCWSLVSVVLGAEATRYPTLVIGLGGVWVIGLLSGLLALRAAGPCAGLPVDPTSGLLRCSCTLASSF